MFKLTEKQQEQLNKWLNENNPDAYTGAIGGRITYCFTPTAIGTFVKIEDGLTGKTVDLTDYENL